MDDHHAELRIETYCLVLPAELRISRVAKREGEFTLLEPVGIPKLERLGLSGGTKGLDQTICEC